MERTEKRRNQRTQTEVCFVRKLELLTQNQLRLVMRDKIAPLAVGGEESLQRAAYAMVRMAHSDEALAVMFDVEVGHSVGTMSFTLKTADGKCSVELSSDGQRAWVSGASEELELKHKGAADDKLWWHLVVLPLKGIALSNNASGVEIEFNISMVDELASSKNIYADLKLECSANLV